MSTTEHESSQMMLWIICKGLGKAYEMAIRKLPSGHMQKQRKGKYLP